MAIRSTTQIAQPVGPAPELPSTYPTPPKKLVGIDPELEKYHAEQERLYRRIREALSQQGVQVAKSAAEVVKTTTNLSTQLVNLGTVISTTEAELLAAINAEAGIRQTNDGVIATSVTNLTTFVNNEFSAVNQTLVTQAQINGQLNASYTLTTTAGNVVTGMRLLSSSGGSGTDVSQVLFQADRFTIYNGTLGVPVFDLNGANIRIGGVTIDSGTGDKLYIGAGNYANSDTSFYVDSTGRMSLKDKLSWDGSNLTLKGNLLGGQTDYDTGTGFFLGYSGSAYKFSIGNSAGNKLTWDGTQLNLVGDQLKVTGARGSIEMQASTSISVPSEIRFKDNAGNTRGTLNSDGTFTLRTAAGVSVFGANATTGLASDTVATVAIKTNAVTDSIAAFTASAIYLSLATPPITPSTEIPWTEVQSATVSVLSGSPIKVDLGVSSHGSIDDFWDAYDNDLTPALSFPIRVIRSRAGFTDVVVFDTHLENHYTVFPMSPPMFNWRGGTMSASFVDQPTADGVYTYKVQVNQGLSQYGWFVVDRYLTLLQLKR